MRQGSSLTSGSTENSDFGAAHAPAVLGIGAARIGGVGLAVVVGWARCL